MIWEIITIIILCISVLLVIYSVLSDFLVRCIPLEIEMIPGDIDPVLESFRVGNNVDVAGLIGTDFLEKYGYIIDFKRSVVWHMFHRMKFKEAMELIGIPYVTLWQDDRKYIFILDTGSTRSHVSTRALKTLKHMSEKSNTVTLGAGGNIKSDSIVKTKLYYK